MTKGVRLIKQICKTSSHCCWRADSEQIISSSAVTRQPFLRMMTNARYGMQKLVDGGLSAADYPKTDEYETKSGHGREKAVKENAHLEIRSE